MTTPSGESLTFQVDGMTCAACAARIERVLSKQEGVDTAVVNFAGAEARVRVGDSVDPHALEAAVEKIGYHLTVVSEGEERQSLAARYSEEERSQWRLFWWAAAFTAPLMLLAMAGPMDALWSRLVQWMLATPVVFVAGFQFHREIGRAHV